MSKTEANEEQSGQPSQSSEALTQSDGNSSQMAPVTIGEEPGEEREGFIDFLKELPVLIVVAFGIALLIKTFLVQAFFIPSGSMENTLLIGDRVLVSKVTFHIRDPKRGDIIVFVSPTEAFNPRPNRGPIGNFINSLGEGLGLKSPERDFIKRVIGLPGQTVQVKEGHVWIDGKKLTEPYIHDQVPMPDYGPLKVGKNELFVMGDNRGNSQDSRVFGPIKESSVVGRAFVLIWPVDRFRILHSGATS